MNWEPVNAQRKDDQPPDRSAAVSDQKSGRILIVDDDPYFLRVLSRILSDENFQVATAPSAQQARELLEGKSFDLVITDLRMPDDDGLTFLQRMRARGIEVPVIILTAYGEVETYLAAMNAGAVEYLNKPVRSEELLRAVRSSLRSRHATR